MEDPRDRLEVGFALDRRWHWLMGGVERSKEEALRSVVAILERSGTPYAIIGGIALQLYVAEPRTTVDIDIAVRSRADIPVAELERAGFTHRGSFEHSENWRAPDGTAVQFSDDALLVPGVDASVEQESAGLRLRVLRPEDLLHAKLRAASDPARRQRKRLVDLADAHALIEVAPSLMDTLTPKERALLEREI